MTQIPRAMSAHIKVDMMMETTSNRQRVRHLLIDGSFWGSYLLAGLLLAAAMLLSSCAIYPAYPVAPVYYGPPYYGEPYAGYPYYYGYPRFYGPRFYGPRFYGRGFYHFDGHRGFGCRWHC
ncbi:MAG: hypothetical protein ABWY00_07300 [Dongiaceae bacterium]